MSRFFVPRTGIRTAIRFGEHAFLQFVYRSGVCASIDCFDHRIEIVVERFLRFLVLEVGLVEFADCHLQGLKVLNHGSCCGFDGNGDRIRGAVDVAVVDDKR